MNARQERFVHEYVIDRNATRAAKAAGYSKKTARSQGQRLLTDVDIAAAVAKVQRERIEEAEITAEMILKGLHREAETAESDSARVAAWSWLGRARALFIDKQQVEHSTPTLIRIVIDGEEQ